MDPRTVAVALADEPAYPNDPPFHPHGDAPGNPFSERSDAPNHAYDAVRRAFELARLDDANTGTAAWNPLGDLIRPGETVVLKPNLVKEFHPRDPLGWRYVLTHGSVIRAVADHVFRAVGPEGRIVIADAPQTDSSFTRIVEVLGLLEVQAFYREHGFELELIDLRQEEWETHSGVVVARHALPGDPRGAVAFDLAANSAFAAHGGSGRYYGAFYDEHQVNRHHSGGRHEYLLSGTVMQADVVFSLPKLKTHKKAGITASLKNLVGVNADKNWLPHHTEGNPSSGGDEFPNSDPLRRLERFVARRFRRFALHVPKAGPWLMRQARPVGLSLFGDTENVVRSGNWWGNDTVWRMCLDLNKIVFYGRADGTMRDPSAARRRHFSLVDGIIGGQGRGPMNPDPVESGVVLFGVHPASVDAACVLLMGFDPERVPIVREAFRCERYPLAEWDWRDVHIVSDRDDWSRGLVEVDPESTFHFEPHFGWTGRIERAGWVSA